MRLLLMRRDIDAPLIRTFGWSLSLIGLTVVAAIVVPNWSPGPVIGSGGYLGALGAGLLEMHFATIGSLILATSLVLGGLLLSTDYALMHIAHAVLGATVSGVAGGRLCCLLERLPNGPAQPVMCRRMSCRFASAAWRWTSRRKKTRPRAKTTRVGKKKKRKMLKARTWRRKLPSRRPGTAGSAKRSVTSGRKGPVHACRQGNPKSERQQVMQSLDEASLPADAQDYQLPGLDLLIGADDICFEAQAKEVRRKAKILEQTFANFGFNVKVVEIETGPVIAQYEVELEAGLRLSQNHQPGRRSGDRSASAQRADRGADPRQEHGRHRSTERDCGRSCGCAK